MPYRIAVADSSVSVQKALQLVFPEPEDKVAAFDDGLAFLTALPDLRPDAILAALNLPGRDGYEIARFLKGREEYRRVPLILLRGAFEPLDEERLIGLEPRAVVTKPFDSEKLAAAVRDLVDQEVCPPDLPEDPVFEKPSSSGMAGGRGPEDRPLTSGQGPEDRPAAAPAGDSPEVAAEDERLRALVRREVLEMEREVEKRVRIRVLAEVRETLGAGRGPDPSEPI
jgi:CheY-like chemotaxis protein